MTDTLTPKDQRALHQAAVRASEQGWGIAMGLLCGLALFFATVFLVVKGGQSPGAHLGLLAVYFPGYRVTFPGAFIGFVYAFVLGYAAGRTVATLYNKISPR
jgi:hypothetical protein